jgi:hypothetical protein
MVVVLHSALILQIMIDLQKKVHDSFKPKYSLSQVAPQKCINESLEKKFILHSKSLVGVTIQFVKKNDDSIGLCVDYCGIGWVCH